MKFIFVMLIIMALSSGCASGVQKMRDLEPGMTPSDVEKIMGKRDSFKSVEHQGSTYTLYQYTNQYCNFNQSMWDKCDFFIIFKDQKVVETGVRNVRSQMPNMHFLYLFNN